MLHPQQTHERRFQLRSKPTGYHPCVINLLNDINNSNNRTQSSTPQSSHKKTPKIFTSCCGHNPSQHSIAQKTEPSEKKVTKEKRFSSSDKTDPNFQKIKEKRKSDTEQKETEKEPPLRVSLVEYYEDEIDGEKIIVNKHHLYTTDDGDDDITIVIRDYTTPLNFTKSLEYYQQINKARETYLRAAVVAGDCLQRGQCQGDKQDWTNYMMDSEQEKKQWRRNCVQNDEIRDKEVRHLKENLDCCQSCTKICHRVWRTFVNEFKDIFPCCFGE